MDTHVHEETTAALRAGFLTTAPNLKESDKQATLYQTVWPRQEARSCQYTRKTGLTLKRLCSQKKPPPSVIPFMKSSETFRINCGARKSARKSHRRRVTGKDSSKSVDCGSHPDKMSVEFSDEHFTAFISPAFVLFHMLRPSLLMMPWLTGNSLL